MHYSSCKPPVLKKRNSGSIETANRQLSCRFDTTLIFNADISSDFILNSRYNVSSFLVMRRTANEVFSIHCTCRKLTMNWRNDGPIMFSMVPAYSRPLMTQSPNSAQATSWLSCMSSIIVQLGSPFHGTEIFSSGCTWIHWRQEH